MVPGPRQLGWLRSKNSVTPGVMCDVGSSAAGPQTPGAQLWGAGSKHHPASLQSQPQPSPALPTSAPTHNTIKLLHSVTISLSLHCHKRLDKAKLNSMHLSSLSAQERKVCEELSVASTQHRAHSTCALARPGPVSGPGRDQPSLTLGTL